MAQYKYDMYLKKADFAAYDTLHQPGVPAPNAGIYRCEVCSHEIAIAEKHILPSQTHAQHDPKAGKIQWRLIVFAQHNAEKSA